MYGMPPQYAQQHTLGLPPQFQPPPGQQQPAARYGPGALQPLGSVGPGVGQQGPPGSLGLPLVSKPDSMAYSADLDAAVRAAGEEVRQLFAVGGQQLLDFVTHVPNRDSIDIVSEMTRRLSR